MKACSLTAEDAEGKTAKEEEGRKEAMKKSCPKEF